MQRNSSCSTRCWGVSFPVKCLCFGVKPSDGASCLPGVHQEGRSPHRVPGVCFLQGSVCLRGQQELLRVPGGHLPELSQRLQGWGKVTRLCFPFGGALGEGQRGGKGKRSQVLELNCCRDKEGKQSLATGSGRWVWLSPCGVMSKPKP